MNKLLRHKLKDLLSKNKRVIKFNVLHGWKVSSMLNRASSNAVTAQCWSSYLQLDTEISLIVAAAGSIDCCREY